MSLTFASDLRKWAAVLGIWLKDGVAYRAQGIIWVFADLVTIGATMPVIWIAAARSNGGTVGGYSIGQMASYYLVMLTLTGFISSHIMWEIATEIKEGQFSSALLRPISYYQFSFLRNLSWRLMRPILFLPFLTLFVLGFHAALAGAQYHFSLAFVASVLAGHVVSFCFVMAMAPIAFFTQEVYSIFEIYYVPQSLLSGAMFPISVLPAWAAGIPKALPFYYTVGAPSEMLVGRIAPGSEWRVVGIQVCWAALLYLVGKLLWSRGLKAYAGTGM
jgi:ABC-2 type transport system permease protein